MGGAASVAENSEEDSDDEDEFDKCLKVQDNDRIQDTEVNESEDNVTKIMNREGIQSLDHLRCCL